MTDTPQGSDASQADDDSYRMTPVFRSFLAAVGSVERAMVAWDIAHSFYVPNGPDDDADYEVWQGGEMVAGCSGPRRRAIAEAVHYAVVYQADDSPCTIQEVTRREVSSEEAHALLVTFATQEDRGASE